MTNSHQFGYIVNKYYIYKFLEPISADQLQIWSRSLDLIETPTELTNIDNLLAIKSSIYEIDPSKYKNYLINFIRALLKKPNLHRVILVDLIYLLKICQDDLLSLYATLRIFYDIGFRTTFDYDQPCLIFNYEDVSHCKQILFWLQLHCRIGHRYIDYKTQTPTPSLLPSNYIICYKKYEEKLIKFIKLYCNKYNKLICNDIIGLISKFVVIDFEMTDSWGNYIKSIFSFPGNQENNNDNNNGHTSSSIKLNVYDIQKDESFDILIKDIVRNKGIYNIHEMIVLKNQSVPNWINWHYDDSDDYDDILNGDDLTAMYITYNDENRATDYILFNKYKRKGFRFKKDKNNIMKSYKGIYHPLLHKLICLDGKYKNIGYLYDIDTNQYLHFNLNFNISLNNDFNACLCDKYNKLFYCQSDKTLIIDLNHDNFNYKQWKNNRYFVKNMLLKRSGHSLLYHDKLSQIIIGGGYEGNDIMNNWLSGRTIELYDIYKNCWNIIDIKTNYFHSNHPSLWYDLFNPFIINIENNDFYSSEFFDIRQQKQWIKNHQRRNFLQSFKNENTLVFS